MVYFVRGPLHLARDRQRQLNYFPQAHAGGNPKLRDWSLNPEKPVSHPTIDYSVISLLTDSAPLPVENPRNRIETKRGLTTPGTKGVFWNWHRAYLPTSRN